VAGSGAPDADDPLLGEAARLLEGYFAGRGVCFDLPLDPAGISGFGRAVLDACARIPHGATATYGELAAQIGRPGAARAVGQALGRNPLPVVIPCHRVIGADGRLVGFGSGLGMKRRLLELEGIDVDVP
jgi:methylated-DNA-[protein]-cysteine S-methyltransferase